MCVSNMRIELPLERPGHVDSAAVSYVCGCIYLKCTCTTKSARVQNSLHVHKDSLVCELTCRSLQFDVCTCMYVCVYVCVYVCNHVCMYACVNVCMYVSIHLHMCIYCMCVCIYVYIYMYIVICMHALSIHIHTYMYTPTHMYTRGFICTD